MPADLQFYHMQTLNHNGTVVVFGESKRASANNSDREHKLWYRVLDLEQISDENSPNVWDDNTRWTDWIEIPYPDELRNVAQSLLTVRQTVGDAVHDHLHHWRVISDDENIFLFRALDLAAALGRGASPSLSQNGAAPAPLESEATQIRIYANRYALIRDASPAGGTNRAASGKEVTVPQLKLRSESRYRRSGMRETPTSDIDGQGYLDMGDQPFREPTMEFSMLAPLEGLFTVTLAPASIPQRRRWQFFVKAPDRHIAAYSLLRDEDGWFDAEEKYDQFNLSNRKYRFTPDQLFVIKHAGADDPLELFGRPDCIMFRMQEESSGLVGNKEQMLSPERVLLTGRFKMGEETHLVTADFGLDNVGAADVPQTVTIDTVNFARTALHLNGETDLVTLPADVSAISDTMTFSAWVRHNEGEGTLVKRGDPETNGFAIEWRPGEKTLVALLSGTVATGDSSEAADDGSGAPDDATRTDDAAALAPGIELKAPLPTSHTWHHIALVVDTEGAALYIDGEEVSHTEGAVTGFTTGGETVIGGPSQADPEKSWLDFEIDQIVLWSDVRPPSIDNIYRKLDDAELGQEELLGCWQMDDAYDGNPDVVKDSSTHGNNGQVVGADHVNQTAPIFKPMAGNFEDTLTGLSVGMGMIKFDTDELSDDPSLFLSADGLVHLYTTAKPSVTDDPAASEEVSRRELVSLQYDTTSTRVQFNLDWEAVVEGTGNKIEGDVILTARTSGPIMNRTQVSLVEEQNLLNLTISNPRIGLTETWIGLPKKALDLVAVLNGEASATAPDEAVVKGEKVLYDYAANARYNGEPLKGAVLGQNKSAAVASPTFMALLPGVPQNGAEAMVQPDESAKKRQQGNFGGWVHAEVAISGRFDVRENGGPIATSVDLSQDALMTLCCPGDFGLEAWVRPDQIPLDQLADGATRESRLITLNGEPETAAYTLGLRAAWSISLGGTRRLTKNVTDGEPLLSSEAGLRNQFGEDAQPVKGEDNNQQESFNESFTIGVRFNTPDTAEQTGSLFQLISENAGGHMFYAELDLDGVWFKFIDENYQAQGIYAPFGDSRGESVFVAFVWDIATGDENTPGIERNRDGFIRLYIDDDLRASRAVRYTDFHEIRYLNLGAPNRDDNAFNKINDRLEDLRRFLNDEKPEDREQRNTRIGPNFWRGADVTIQAFYVWDFALDATSLVPGALTQRFLQLLWDFSAVQIVQVPTSPILGLIGLGAASGQIGVVANTGISMNEPGPWGVSVSTSDLEAGYRVFAAASERQVSSNAQLPPDKWSHVAAVCTGNHALSFNPSQNQRAIVRDSGGLNADKAFTIDCNVRWNGGTDTQDGRRDTQYLLSRTDASQTDMAFQLGIHSNGPTDQSNRDTGQPFLRFSMIDAAGNEQSQEILGSAPLTKGVSYYLVARCVLQDHMHEDEPNDRQTNRWQLWQLDARIWSFNLDTGQWNGPAPLEGV